MKYTRAETVELIQTLRLLTERGIKVTQTLVADAERPDADLLAIAERFEKVTGAIHRTILISERLANRLAAEDAKPKFEGDFAG